MESQRVRHDWLTNTHTHIAHFRRKRFYFANVCLFQFPSCFARSARPFSFTRIVLWFDWELQEVEAMSTLLSPVSIPETQHNVWYKENARAEGDVRMDKWKANQILKIPETRRRTNLSESLHWRRDKWTKQILEELPRQTPKGNNT